MVTATLKLVFNMDALYDLLVPQLILADVSKIMLCKLPIKPSVLSVVINKQKFCLIEIHKLGRKTVERALKRTNATRTFVICLLYITFV